MTWTCTVQVFCFLFSPFSILFSLPFLASCIFSSISPFTFVSFLAFVHFHQSLSITNFNSSSCSVSFFPPLLYFYEISKNKDSLISEIIVIGQFLFIKAETFLACDVLLNLHVLVCDECNVVFKWILLYNCSKDFVNLCFLCVQV